MLTALILAASIDNPTCTLDLPAGDAKASIAALVTQCDVESFFLAETINALVPALHGTMPLSEALDTLLKDTGIQWSIRHDPDPYLTLQSIYEPQWIDGEPYTCAPSRWMSGMLFNPLAQLYLDLGFGEGELLCFPLRAQAKALEEAP